MEYLDFELEIRAGRGRSYPVELVRSPAGEGQQALLRLPFDSLALENKLQTLQLALLRSPGRADARRRVLLPEEQAVQEFGRALFDALLAGEVRTRYAVSRAEAARQGKGLRLKLRIQVPELAALPWEFLYDPDQAQYICLSRATPLVRYVDLPQSVQSLTVTPPLRILGMIANPADLAPLDTARERQRVEAAVQDLRARGLLELTWLPGATWRHLQEAMWTGPWHIFHFVGHGGFDATKDEGFLALVNADDGQMDPVSATLVARLLDGHQPLRLVLLNSCEGARGSSSDIFASTAATIVQGGTPAVVAMQYEISDRAAIEFAHTFYRAVAQSVPVDAAVTEARKAVSLALRGTLEWGTPVLHLRAPDGVLFRVGPTSASVLLHEAQLHPPATTLDGDELPDGRSSLQTPPPKEPTAVDALSSAASAENAADPEAVAVGHVRPTAATERPPAPHAAPALPPPPTMLTGSLLSRRLLAALLDFVIASMLFLAVFMILPLPFGSVYKAEVATAQGAANDTVATKEFSLLGDAVIAIAIIVCAAYYIVLEARTGQTLGKKVVSIKVVAADGTPIGYRASFIRNMLRVVDGLPLFYVLGIICIIATRGRQRIGDRAAGTVMVIA